MFEMVLMLMLPPTLPQDDVDFWKEPTRAQAAAAAELVLAGNAWTTLILRDLGRRYSVWGNELSIARDQVPPLDEEWLNLIEDKKAVPDFRGRAADEIKDYEFAFQKVYAEALAYSFLVDREAFAVKSKDYPHVTFAHLYNDPDKYRGKVIRIEGLLARVRQYDAPLAAQRLGAYKHLYEGWVGGKTKNAPPFCIIFPNKPDDIPISESMRRSVVFEGYFISIIRYRAANEDHYAALLIGPTVAAKEPAKATESPSPISMPLLFGVVGFVAVVIVALIVLNVVLSKGDRRVRSHLENLQASRGMEMLENEAGKTEGNGAVTPGDAAKNEETG